MSPNPKSLLFGNLIERLPAAGEDWTLEDRARWLRAASAIFDLVYKTTGDFSRIEITITKP